jgi:hypothetical protein
MDSLDLPAGASVRLTATARPDYGLHRWDIRVVAATGGASRAAGGARIGGRDVHQRLDIPPQDVDCRLEVSASHAAAGGWAADRGSRTDDTPDRLLIGFSDAARPGSRRDDVLLSFTFGRREARPEEEHAHGQGPEEIQPRDAKTQAGQGERAAPGPLLP